MLRSPRTIAAMQTMQRSALASRCVQRVFAVARPSARKQATVAAHGGQTRLNASLLPCK